MLGDGGFNSTASISSILLRLNNGLNKVYFDDTYAQMDVFGGPLRDGEFLLPSLNLIRRKRIANISPPSQNFD